MGRITMGNKVATPKKKAPKRTLASDTKRVVDTGKIVEQAAHHARDTAGKAAGGAAKKAYVKGAKQVASSGVKRGVKTGKAIAAVVNYVAPGPVRSVAYHTGLDQLFNSNHYDNHTSLPEHAQGANFADFRAPGLLGGASIGPRVSERSMLSQLGMPPTPAKKAKNRPPIIGPPIPKGKNPKPGFTPKPRPGIGDPRPGIDPSFNVGPGRAGAGSGAGAGGTHTGGGTGGTTKQTKPKYNAATVTPPDQIEQMIQGALQQNQRLTSAYTQQTEAQRQAAVADAAKLSAYTAMPASTSSDPLTQQLANEYTNLVNGVGSATQGQNAASGNAIQQLLTGQSNAANLATVEYGRRLRANEPAMRAEQAAAEAKMALDVAQQQYLRDKLSLDGKKALDSSALGWAGLNQRGEIANMNNSTRRDIAAANARTKAALAGVKADGATRKEIMNWVNDNLYTQTSTTAKNPDGTQSITAKGREKIVMPYDQILQQMASSGFDPVTAAQVAINHAPKSAKAAGPSRFFSTLIQSGVSKRQAVRLIGALFSPKDAKFIQRNSAAILKNAEAVNGATDAVSGVVDAVTGLL